MRKLSRALVIWKLLLDLFKWTLKNNSDGALHQKLVQIFLTTQPK